MHPFIPMTANLYKTFPLKEGRERENSWWKRKREGEAQANIDALIIPTIPATQDLISGRFLKRTYPTLEQYIPKPGQPIVLNCPSSCALLHITRPNVQ